MHSKNNFPFTCVGSFPRGPVPTLPHHKNKILLSLCNIYIFARLLVFLDKSYGTGTGALTADFFLSIILWSLLPDHDLSYWRSFVQLVFSRLNFSLQEDLGMWCFTAGRYNGWIFLCRARGEVTSVLKYGARKRSTAVSYTRQSFQ